MKTNAPDMAAPSNPPVTVPAPKTGPTVTLLNTPPSSAEASTPAAPATQRTARHKQRRSGRRWLPYVGAAILVGLIVAGLWPKPSPVETATVSVGPLRATVNEEGKTRIRQRFLVAAPVSGQLRRIPFKAGAEVKANETVVAVIEPLAPLMLDARSRAVAEATRDTAVANAEKARVAHAFAASELQRFTKLHADNVISIHELESAQWREASAAREKTAAESALRQAEAELIEFATGGAEPSSTRTPREIKAPVNGRVLRVFEESSRVISAGTPLMEIGDPADLEVAIEVLSRDGAAMTPGLKVDLEQWGGDEPLHARLRLVEPAAFTKVSALGVEEQRVNVIADIVTPPEKRLSLGDNFRVEARIIVWEAENALKLPSGALFRRGRDWGVFAIRHGRARFQPVTVGRSSGIEMQVIDGLSDGDEVIVYPGDRIADGQRVRAITIAGP